MRTRAFARALPALGLLAVACGGGGTESASDAPSGGGADGPTGDAADAIHFTEEEWALLATLAPPALPGAPPDVSNRWADDPAAAALGSTFFFEPGFSGALLDADNDGGPNTLGTRGQPGRVACEGCHLERAGFSDTRSAFQEISLGTGWTARRTPSLLDVGQAKMVLWGGRHSTLHGQVFGPLENPLEMNTSRLFVAQFVAAHHREAYEAIFGADALAPLADTDRFPPLTAAQTGCQLTAAIAHPRAQPPDPSYTCHGMPGDGAEYDGMAAADQELVTRVVVNVGKAIAAYERTLACGPGRFDAFVHGDPTALDATEQRGLALFIGRAGCVTCHDGPFLSDQRFHNVGVAQTVTREGILNDGDRGAAVDLALAAVDPLGVGGVFSDGDDGRLPSAGAPELEGAFRTPTLRCVGQRPTYMHTGLVPALDAAVAFFDRGGDPGGYPGVNELEPLGLTVDERRALVAFLRALDGADAR